MRYMHDKIAGVKVSLSCMTLTELSPEREVRMPTEEPDATVALSSLCRNVERWLELQADSAAALLSAAEQEHQQLLTALDTVEKQCADTQSLVKLGAAAAAQ
jgi:hypothetical protein